MANPLDPSLLPETVGGVAGWVISAAFAVFTIITQFRKGKVDESALVLGEWKKLFEAHKERVESLAKRVEDLEKENTGLRERVKALEEDLSAAKDKNIELLEENSGLKRQVAQMAGSAVVLLDKKPAGDDEFLDKTREARRGLDDID